VMFKKKAGVKLSTVLFQYIGKRQLVIAVYFLGRLRKSMVLCLISTGCDIFGSIISQDLLC
jgi:hypothetical protein